MADNQQQNPGMSSNTFSKGMLKDTNETFVGEGLYTHARNAVNNSHDGQVGVIGNEPSNLSCVTLPYPMIGCIHLGDDQWAIFTTDDIDSEIGIFDESACTYSPIKNQLGQVIDGYCLGFKRSHLITGVFRKRYDCERVIYWDDGLNPTRTMDIDKPPCVQSCITNNNCTTCIDTTQLDCERIRVVPHVKHPCIKISKGKLGGTLPNGSYQACIGYTINEVRVTDYIGLTAVQGIWSHENTSGSLEIRVTDLDPNFDEFELVLLTNINSQTVAKKIGYYTSAQGTIYVDRWDMTLPTVNPGSVVFRSEPIERTDGLYSISNYILRTGVYSKFKFNYQPLANNIKVNWASVEYPASYYSKGNHNVGYMRDEQYAFFIRFVYNTGESSESYHIPGRAALPSDRSPITGDDAFETYVYSQTRERWQVENTATITATPNYYLDDGGYVIATGEMGYWESEEKYPSNRFDIWVNLCGEKIRHHKMPDETISTAPNNPLSIYAPGGEYIRLLGVQFSNIVPPLDLNGNPIQSIVGYEILRGSREGNKSIVAKGLFNNMRDYSIPGNSRTGLFQNYPYNDLNPDPYLTTARQSGDNGQANVSSPLMNNFRNDIYSFHSPDTTFSNPYLATNEVKMYQTFTGTSSGTFQIPLKHPKFKQVTDLLAVVTTILGILNRVETVGVIFNGGSAHFTGTEDLPTTFTYELPPFPTSPSGAGGNITGPAMTFVAYAWYVINLIAWLAIAIAITALMLAMAEVKSQKVYQVFLFLCPYVQHAAQYNSHGFYNNYQNTSLNNRRRYIEQANYVGSGIQQFGTFIINNLNRSKFVALKLGYRYINGPSGDNSRFTLGCNAIGDTLTGNIASYYGAIKIPSISQYGQLESIRQVPVSNCVTNIGNTSTSVMFGGDVYINRFTEKNTMFFFTDWLLGQPNGYDYNYTLYFNIPYARFWINTFQDKAQFFTGVFSKYPSDYRCLDCIDRAAWGFLPSMYLKKGWYYLFNSGVRDFFVESEVNVAYRDWEEDVPHRHYDYNTYTDIDAMFQSDIIKSGNYYKYDYSLSASKLAGSSVSWGYMLPRDYYPNVYSTCYTYRPNRVIYSLPQQDQSKKDNWRVYLNNNYKDFASPVTCIKQINKTGGLFMMKYMSPMSFMGVEELKTDGTGAKITIGDGGLFQQPLQAVVNADASYEYGSNQGRYCSVNTIYGVFWVSQNQGKVFNHAGQLSEISNNGLKWWFSRYLPSTILKEFPEYALGDNPVVGIGVQMIYDNTNEILYITKKDYNPKFTKAQGLTLDPTDNSTFLYNNIPVQLGDPSYFENASWTISYDPKSKAWISFHDWIPSFLIPGKAHFMSVNNDSIWKHNIRCDNYCNFYGVDYPFEVEFISATGQQVNSMRSIEYLLEAYTIHNNCRDKFHVLDENFDQAIIYNSEQISGVLKLNVKGKDDPLGMLTYPRINTNPDYIDIQFSKEENKYRFNQFWDITKNRGEILPTNPTGFNLPMFNTEANGYIYPINPLYVDYNKPPLQRKKFRHNVNKVFLRRFKSDNFKFLFKISNQKLLQSPR